MSQRVTPSQFETRPATRRDRFRLTRVATMVEGHGTVDASLNQPPGKRAASARATKEMPWPKNRNVETERKPASR